MFIFEHRREPILPPSLTLSGVTPQKPRRGESGLKSGLESSLENVVVILVVEDDQWIQDMIEEALTEGGFEITIASSGARAIELLDAANPEYRALVTDINLGKETVDGWAVARHARENKPDIPVVYMTGDSADEWASKGVPNSILLTKPFAPAQLITAVSQLLNSGTPTA
jgi:CheY-like chemotaxis protein